VGDGRNHLVMTRKKYDVIISEPSNPWIAGEAALFTKEYFQSVRDHLEPAGVFCCWMQAYQMSPDQFGTIMRTYQSVFPEATLWETLTGADFMLVGSVAPIRLDLATMDKRMQSKTVAEDLKRISFNGIAELLGRFLMGPRHFIMSAGDGEYHIDDRMQLEYMAPRYLYSALNPYREFYDKITRFREHPMVITGNIKQASEYADALDRETKARDDNQDGTYSYYSGRAREALGYMAESVKLSPHNLWYRNDFTNSAIEIGKKLGNSEKYMEAAKLFEGAVEIVPDSFELRDMLGTFYMYLELTEKAREQFEKAASLNPKDYLAFYNIAYIDLDAKKYDDAMENLRRAIEARPDYAPALNAIGSLLIREQRLSEAESYFRKAVEFDPLYPAANANLGRLLLEHRDEKKRQEGRSYIEKALKLDPSLAQDENQNKLLQNEGK